MSHYFKVLAHCSMLGTLMGPSRQGPPIKSAPPVTSVGPQKKVLCYSLHLSVTWGLQVATIPVWDLAGLCMLRKLSH